MLVGVRRHSLRVFKDMQYKVDTLMHLRLNRLIVCNVTTIQQWWDYRENEYRIRMHLLAHSQVLSFTKVSFVLTRTYRSSSLVPRPRPTFHRLQYGKAFSVLIAIESWCGNEAYRSRRVITNMKGHVSFIKVDVHVGGGGSILKTSFLPVKISVCI